MKSNKTNRIFRIWVVVFLISSLSILKINSQEITSDQDSLTIDLPFILSEIPTEFTKLSNHLIELDELIKPQEKIVNNDSIVSAYSVSWEASKQEIEAQLPSLTYQRLESLIRAWYNYKSKFDNVQKTLIDRINEIQSVKNELDEELQRWKTISEVMEQRDLPDEFKQTADTAIVFLNLMISKTSERSDTLLLIRGNQTKLNLIIDEVIRILEEEQKVFQSNYFIRDSNPIWNAYDSTIQSQNIKSYFKTEIKGSYQNLKVYLQSNDVIVILQLVFIVILIIGFILLSRIWPADKLDSKSKRETQAGIIIRRPFFSSLLIGLIISVFFYTNRPPTLGSFFVILMMFSSLVLLPGLLTQKIKIPILLLFALFVINFLQDFLPYQSLENRIIIILQSLTALLLLFFAYRVKNEFELKSKAKRFLALFIWIFGILMIVAFITNIFGSVKLSDFLISSTIRTLTFSVITITIVILLNSMMILLIKGKKVQSIPLYEQLKKFIDKRIRPLIRWGGFILWLFAALVYFRLLKPAQNLIDDIMDFEFMISTVANSGV